MHYSRKQLKLLTESLVDKYLNIIIENELKKEDFEDYFQSIRKEGFDDEEKLSGIFDRAVEIAKEKGKEDDRETVMGILQNIIQGKK